MQQDSPRAWRNTPILSTPQQLARRIAWLEWQRVLFTLHVAELERKLSELGAKYDALRPAE